MKRMYTKPDLFSEEFDVEDILTASSAGAIISGPGMSGGSNDILDDDEEEIEEVGAQLNPLG